MIVEARPPGRPRSITADRAILDATLDLFTESGFDGLTVEGVAARAGVGKATIYRRYPSKVDLVIAATSCLSDEAAPAIDTGSTAGDLQALARGLVQVLTKTGIGPAMRQIIATVDRNPEMRRAHREFVKCRRASVKEAVLRGIARGEIRTDADPEIVADLIGGPIFYRFLVSGGRIDAAYADRLVATVVGAFST